MQQKRQRAQGETSPTRRSKLVPPGKSSSVANPSAKLGAVVAIGASAGGLEAFTGLLRALPADTGMAFVLIQHLDPKRGSALPQILSQVTAMPVREVTDGLALEPDHVYIIPPDKDIVVSDGVLGLMARSETHGLHMPIDRFFSSLAEDQKDRSIGVILSGTASDGTAGLKAIRAEGGITFAQDEASAKFSGMPHNAAASGGADFVLPPAGIAGELARIAKHPFPRLKRAGQPTDGRAEDAVKLNGEPLQAIFERLRADTGVDFSTYKPTTLKRRILRRMVLHRMATARDYKNCLEKNPDEVRALYQDLLISVTSFFRDPEVFDALSKRVFPEITRHRRRGAGPLRIWVPGCATGEEAYSLAICLLEFLRRRASAVRVQIFATDVFDGAIEKARAGIYGENATKNLSSRQLENFFIRTDGHYQVKKQIREMCVFSKHDLTEDPPFSNLDLISCRNVLIYLEPAAQERIIGNFSYALRSGGFLLLGKSEALGRFPDLFDAVDRKNRIYSRKPGTTRQTIQAGPARPHLIKGETACRPNGEELDIRNEADRVLLSRLAPARVIIDRHFKIVDIRGNTGPFLKRLPGESGQNLLRIAREGLRSALRTAVEQARKRSAAVRKNGLRADTDGALKIDLEVIPLKPSGKGDDHVMVLFKEAGPWPPRGGQAEPRPAKGKKGQSPRKELLERELRAADEQLRTVLDEHETATEELRAANEEAMSANEELQSLNEELETSKEELQSTNEELTTLTDELQNRNVALDKSLDYAEAIVKTVREALLILDDDMRVKSANESYYQTFQTSPKATEGRSLYDLGSGQWKIPELKQLLDDVLPRHAEFQDLEIEAAFPVVGRKTLRLNGRRVLQGPDLAPLILLAFEDVTAQKREAAGREKAEAELSRLQTQKLEAIGTLSGGIAHDLNNILAPIIINAELALMDIPAGAPLREYLNTILKSGLRAKDLVRQVVLFSRRTERKREVFALGLLIKETFKLLRSSIPSTIEMTTHIKTDADAVWGDSTQIQQVIMNLCANAAYALKEMKGSIDISLQSIQLQPGDLDEVDLRPGDYLVLSVADTGVGMDIYVKRRLFEPFFTTKPVGEGTGLGLSVVHGIVDGHNGAVVVESEPGAGAVFRVYLPRVEANVMPASADTEKIPGGKERILLVDDEEVIVNSVRNMLELLGYQVTGLTKSKEALRQFSEDPSRFDLVISDQTMPAMTGEELGRAMKSLRPHIPIILCTGYDDFVATGFEGFLKKPYTVREAAAAIQSVLGRQVLKDS